MIRMTEAQVRALKAQGGVIRTKSSKTRTERYVAPKPITVGLPAPRQLALPHPPSLWRMYNVVNGRLIKSVVGKDYAKELARLGRQVFAQPVTVSVSVVITVHPPKGIGQDVDNCLKACLDSLTGICWVDDSQVWRLLVERSAPVAGGALLLKVEAYGEDVDAAE